MATTKELTCLVQTLTESVATLTSNVQTLTSKLVSYDSTSFLNQMSQSLAAPQDTKEKEKEILQAIAEMQFVFSSLLASISRPMFVSESTPDEVKSEIGHAGLALMVYTMRLKEQYKEAFGDPSGS